MIPSAPGNRRKGQSFLRKEQIIFAYTNNSSIFASRKLKIASINGMKTSDSKFKQCFYFASGALARIVEKLAIDVWKKVDLSPSHAYVLLLVLDEPGIQPGTISGQLHLSPSTITRLLEKLESKKLVVRTSEGKLTNVYPTPKAKEIHPQMIACAEEFAGIYYKAIGKEECDGIIDAITKMADKLEH